MLKEITHEKAIEILKSGGEIVFKNSNGTILKYSVCNKNGVMYNDYTQYNRSYISVGWFLTNQVYIDTKPFSLTVDVIVDTDDSLGEIVDNFSMLTSFAVDINYKVEVSKETYKPIDMGQVISNYNLGRRLYASEQSDSDIIFGFNIDDSFPVSSLKKYNWYEDKKSTSIHKIKLSEFFDFYPGKFYTGPCTITITEIENE